jgi:hypothetical protein
MITNIENLREELAKMIERVKAEPRFVGQAVEINNAAGKIIQSCKVQIEYMHMIKAPAEIEFMKISKKTENK